MTQLEDLDLLARAFDSQSQQIRSSLESFAKAYWESMPNYREDAIEQMIEAIAPRVAAGQVQVAKLTNEYLKQCYKVLGLDIDLVPVDEVKTVWARGVDPKKVYQRPGSTVYANLAEGKSFEEAVKAGGLRLHQLVGGDVQLAHRNQARRVLSLNNSKVKAYRRVLTGRENCGLCVVAATQRYHVADLLPIHPGCDCTVQPLPPEFADQQVIDEDLLAQAHAAAKEQFGEADYGARGLEYKKLILVSEHGEYGPVMSWTRKTD